MSRPDGLYADVPHDDYHADPALSSTGVRHLTPPDWCPAKFRYEVDHPTERKPSAAMDIGQAYHTLAFGAGPEVVVIEAKDWRTNAAKDARDEARTAGLVPLLPDDYAGVQDMVRVLRADPTFQKVVTEGEPEASYWWHDYNGVQCRARADWLPKRSKGRLILPDLKSAKASEAGEFMRTSGVSYGYAQQADWYLRGLRALDVADQRAVFLFIAQETTPPYVVEIIQPNADAMRVAEILNDRALETYLRCVETGVWGGYHDGITLAGLPGWYSGPILESELTA